jgi:hypothetical protein
MSDDLVKRLRELAGRYDEAADRIENLEEEVDILISASIRLASRIDIDSDAHADRIEKLEATLRWICGSRTIEYFDGTVQADETKMLWTYRRIAREALEGTYDERIFKDPT